MQMQIAFREAPEKPDGMTVHMAAGFLSCTADHFEAERITHFMVGSSDGKMSSLALGSTGTYPGRDRWSGEREHMSRDLGNIVTSQVWPKPTYGDHLFVHLRATRMPGEDGCTTAYAFSGLLYSDGLKIDCDAVHVFDGEGLRRIDDLAWAPPMVEATRGNALNQFYRIPTWGWAAEPVGLRGTMHLRILDEMDRQRELHLGGDVEGTDKAEYEKLNESLHALGLGNVYGREKEFELVMRDLYARCPEIVGRSSKPETQAEMDEYSAEMKISLRTVLEGDSQTQAFSR